MNTNTRSTQEPPVWDGTPKDAMRFFLEHAVEVGLMAKGQGIEVSAGAIVGGIIDQLDKIARESYPLYRMQQEADLILHAEGPGAAQHLPWLAALNWLTGTSQRVLRAVAASWFDLKNANGPAMVKHLDLRLTGMAPGSLWLGFKVQPPQGDLLPQDEALFSELAERLGLLPQAIGYIRDEGLDPAIAEAITDPAERDVMLDALRHLAPTGRAGIHTLDIGAHHRRGRLSQRERVVLNEALRRPEGKDMRYGSFVGTVRAADLDKTRIHLRGVADVGALRCALPEMSKETAKALMGEVVKASGRYATDREGRPRLLMVERIERIGQAALPV